MAAPNQLPTWAEKTLQDEGELVSDPVDVRRTRSQFFGAPQALAATEPLLPINYYMTLGSYRQSNSEAAGNPLWEVSMAEKYSALMENNAIGTWFHFGKEESLFDADGYIEQRLLHMVRSASTKLDLLQKDTHRYMA